MRITNVARLNVEVNTNMHEALAIRAKFRFEFLDIFLCGMKQHLRFNFLSKISILFDLLTGMFGGMVRALKI